jgi:hypothetical protein
MDHFHPLTTNSQVTYQKLRSMAGVTDKQGGISDRGSLEPGSKTLTPLIPLIPDTGLGPNHAPEESAGNV